MKKKTFLDVFHKLKSKNLDQYLSDFAKKKKMLQIRNN